MTPEPILTVQGVNYMPGDEALLRIRAALNLSISGAYRRLKAARSTTRMVIISRNQRWYAIDDIEALIRQEES